MRIQEKLGLLGWTAADKVVLTIYGLVTVLQINGMSPEEYAVFWIFQNLANYLNIVGDSFGLSLAVQFGFGERERYGANLVSVVTHLLITGIPALLLYIFRDIFGAVFDSPALGKIAIYLFLAVFFQLPRLFAIKLFYRDQEMNKLFAANFCYFGTMIGGTVYLYFTRKSIKFEELALLFLSANALASVVSYLLKRKDFVFARASKSDLKRYYKFAFPNTLTNIFHSIPKTLDSLILKLFFDLNSVGIYLAARNLFRIFDDVFAAVNPLVYTSYLKHKAAGNKSELNALATKSASFVLMMFLCVWICGISGLTDWVIATFIRDAKYADATGYFNMMLYSAFFMPFTIMHPGMIAMNRMMRSNLILFASVAIYLGVTLLIGNSGAVAYLPLGLTVYYSVFGLQCYIWAYKELDFKPRQIFRAYGDTTAFVKKIIEKRLRAS